MNCVFCEIVTGAIPCHLIWEGDTHMAFLSSHPNTEGFSVVIPKRHYSSYIFAQDDSVASALVLAARKVALILDQALDDVGRTGMIFEGYGVDHLHAKLFPMHGTGNSSEFKPIASSYMKYFQKYEGYISSHDAAKADEAELTELARRIREYA